MEDPPSHHHHHPLHLETQGLGTEGWQEGGLLRSFIERLEKVFLLEGGINCCDPFRDA